MITRESLRILENNLVFTKFVRRDFDDQFGVSGAKIGQVLNIRKPPRYVGRKGQALQIEDATETSVPLALTEQEGVDIAFSSADLALSIDDFSDRFIKPAIATVANAVDYDGLQQFKNVFNEVGTPGAVPNQLLTYLQAMQKLDEMAAPRDNDRSNIISPAMQATIIDALKGLFQDADSISEQYIRGTMGKTIGAKWSMDQNCGTQVVGAYAPGGATVTVAGQNGASILTTGWPVSTLILKQGDIVTFSDVYAVNPQNRQSTGSLAMWVITQDVISSGGGLATLPISGPGGFGLVTAGPFQNGTNSPGAGATIAVQGASGVGPTPRGLLFHKDAFALGCADLPLPGGVDMAARISDKQLGMSLRLVRAYDINTDRFPCRCETLYGWTTLYPELACRVAS